MKRIVVCCDGTWNTPDEEKDGVATQTNVVKLAQAVKPADAAGTRQLMFYDPGVGTSGNRFKRAFDGATGSGISKNIKQAYEFLIKSYEPGDELFFFGFSRGAFTVRSLAGLIRNSGLLRPDYVAKIPEAYELYRDGGKSTHPKALEATLFRRTYAVADRIPIKFIGVWDTVGALGNPLLLKKLGGGRNKFHDTDLSSTVQYAYQALAIDEKRRHFKATLWNQQAHSTGQTLEQVWFVGVHSNVGGGYKSTGLSDLALQWMIGKAAPLGLDLDPIPARPDPATKPDESRKGFYLLIPAYYRPINKPDPAKGATHETLDASVATHYKSDGKYRPENLEEYYERFPGEKAG